MIRLYQQLKHPETVAAVASYGLLASLLLHGAPLFTALGLLFTLAAHFGHKVLAYLDGVALHRAPTEAHVQKQLAFEQKITATEKTNSDLIKRIEQIEKVAVGIAKEMRGAF